MSATRDDQTLDAPPEETVSSGDGSPVLGSRYRILSLLGAGGMGNVYKALDLELDELVALKVLRPELVGSASMLDRFRREVKLARRVTHPNVARVFDLGERDGEKLITMEFIDGESLAAHLERERRLPTARIIEIASAVCAGLHAAHTAGVVHRDLKPDNVLLEKGGRVVLTDFGIARAAANTSNTSTGLVGTPAYMAPEQVEGRADVDARADIYALGAMLFELSTGELPWTGDSVLAVAAARLLRPPPDPRSVWPSVPPQLAALVLRCMARRPEDRYDAVAVIASELASFTLPGALSVPASATTDPIIDPSGKARKRVAVLPFRNAGPPEHEHIADGLTEELIDVLSVVEGLGVRSRGVVMRYKGVERDPRELGRELDVQVVVEGTVRRTGGTVRISTRLISVADGMQLWARRFDRPEAELLNLSDDTARAIANALAIEMRGPARRSEVDPAAMDLYLKARVAYHQFFNDIGGASSIPLFEQALRLAPDEPRILAGYAMARARESTGIWELDEASRNAADRAIALAPELGEAHLARAVVHYRQGNGPAAMTAARRALRLAPGNAEAHDLVGRMLSETRRLADAKRHLTTALTLDPAMELSLVALARTEELLGNRDEVERLVGDVKTKSSFLPLVARLALWRKDARMASELLKELRPDTLPNRIIQLFLTILVTRQAPEVLPIPTQELALRTPRARSFAAQLHVECNAVLGRRANTLDALERALTVGVVDIAWTERCPLFDEFRTDPRFVATNELIAAKAEPIVAAYLDPAV